MTQRNNSADSSTLVSRDRVIEVVRSMLRNETVVSRRFTADQIADMSGVPLRTVRSYMANDPGEVREPTLSNALSIACVLGPVAINGVLALIGYGGAKPFEEPDALEPMRIIADGLQQFNIIAQAAADGRIDHTEEEPCRHAADRLIAVVLPLASAGRAA